MNFLKKKPKRDEKTQVKENILAEQLSDLAQFSYIATAALTLRELHYEFEEDRFFCKQCLEKLLKDLKQPTQVCESANALLEGHGCDSAAPFITSVQEDETIQRLGKAVVPHHMVSLVLQDGVYDARYRVFIRRIAELLAVPWQEVEEYEVAIVSLLKQEQYDMTEEEKEEKKKRALRSKIKRGAFIGLATVGGGVLLGVTGGLAAPLLAAGIGTVVGAGSAAVLGSAVGVAIIGSLFGVAGAGLGGYKMNKRIGNVEEFEFETLTSEDDMHLTIAVAGWLTKSQPDCRDPWRNMADSGEQYALRYETKYLIEMGHGLDYLMNAAIKSAASEALKFTVLAGIMAAITWPAAILTASSVIDNPWSVCVNRTAAAGKLLAEVLLTRQQGRRPVTLIGFSLGARVVFYCLLELARRKNSQGIIEDAVLLGAPVTASPGDWRRCTRVVAGRIVNGFSKGDWLLKFLYRTASVQMTIAGLQPIALCDRRMVNVDFTHVVSGHLDYRNKLDYLLTLVGVNVKQKEPAEEDTLVRIGLGGNKLSQPTPRMHGARATEKATILPYEINVQGQKGQLTGEANEATIHETKDEKLKVFLVKDEGCETKVGKHSQEVRVKAQEEKEGTVCDIRVHTDKVKSEEYESYNRGEEKEFKGQVNEVRVEDVDAQFQGQHIPNKTAENQAHKQHIVDSQVLLEDPSQNNNNKV